MEEPSWPEYVWIVHEYSPALYCGRAREAWYGEAERRMRHARSFQARVLGGRDFGLACGLAAAAARQATGRAEQRRLAHAARWLAHRIALGTMNAGQDDRMAAVLACLRNDRDGAVAALSEALREFSNNTDGLFVQLYRRRLGVLLDDDEGAAMVAEADAFLRAAGVVNPERFVATSLPGIELPAPT